VDICVHQEGPCQVVVLSGSVDVNASPTLREALLGSIEGGSARIVCDLGEADFIGSDALGVLITAYLKARGRGGFVRLCRPRGKVREVLETTRLDHLFEIFPDRSAAGAGRD
jgi:anti-sigma B factor antagonist